MLLSALSLSLTGACPSSEPSQGRAEVTFGPDISRDPAGWIYAYERRSGRANACVTVRKDSWTLAEQTQPGAFLHVLADGPLVAGELVGLPTAVLTDAANLYVAGAIQASLDGAPIHRHKH